MGPMMPNSMFYDNFERPRADATLSKSHYAPSISGRGHVQYRGHMNITQDGQVGNNPPTCAKRKHKDSDSRKVVFSSSGSSENEIEGGLGIENIVSPYTSGFQADPKSGFGLYRDSGLIETHSMGGRNSAQYSMKWGSSKAKSGFENSKNIGSSIFIMDKDKIIHEADAEGKRSGSSSMNVSDFKGLQNILEDPNFE